MESQKNQTAAAGLPSQPNELTVQAIDQAERHAARLSRVDDYQTYSLAKDDALEANLGSINGGLMRIALWLDETIAQAMESGPRTIEHLQRVSPAIETHLRLTRQMDRLAQMEVRVAESRRPKGKKDSHATASLGVPTAPTATAGPAETAVREIKQSEESEI